MEVRVETRFGRLRGAREGGLAVFRGVPYAAPPVGPLRLCAPRPPEPWAGIRDAREHGPPAPQRPGELTALLGLSADGASEACLTLTVTTPDPAGRRPVLVWLHGGSFVTGSPALAAYDAAELARRGDVVVVGVAYRLGALGFLPLLGADGMPAVPEGEAWANFGLRDQLAALEFVGEHAAAFGGDPECITVFGESAGAMGIGALLGAPAARGRFRRAVLQSGASENVHGHEEALRVALAFADALGCAPGDLDAVRAAPLAAILEAQERTAEAVWRDVRGIPWQPAVDGDLLPRTPLAAVAEGAARDVELLLGTNRHENRLWTALDPRIAALDAERLLRRCRVRLPGTHPQHGPHAERVVAFYQRLHGTTAPPGTLWSEIETDRAFAAPAHRLARAHAAYQPATYLYRFDWESPAFEGRLGACHALEIPFVFGTHRHERLAPMVGSGPEVDALADCIQEHWLAFARNGDPAGPGGPWPAFPSEGGTARILGREPHLTKTPFEPRAALWDSVLGL